MKKLERLDGKLFEKLNPIGLSSMSIINGGLTYQSSGIRYGYPRQGRNTYTDQRDGHWTGTPPVWVWDTDEYNFVWNNGSVYDPYGDDGFDYAFALIEDGNWYHQ